MEATTDTLPTVAPLSFDLKPSFTNKNDEFLLGTIRMPDSPNQKEGTFNELEVKVRYIKDGMGRLGGRGIFLTIQGHTRDGIFKSFMLYQDPSIYEQIAPAARFSSKVLAKVAAEVCVTHRGKIEEAVRHAQDYYLNKTLSH